MRRPDLVADCSQCAALCCTATSFQASEDFGFDKAAGERCRYLRPDHRCSIHEQLVARGFQGCAIYDCYGAGQRTTRAFAASPGREHERNEAFLIARTVHELLWLLTEAHKLCPPSHLALRAELEREIDAFDAIASDCGPNILGVELTERERSARALLRRVGDALGGRSERRAKPDSRRV